MASGNEVVMPLVQITAVVEGKDLDVKKLEQGIRRALEQEAEEIDKLYRAFSASWGGMKPNMIKKVVIRGGNAYAEVSTRGRTMDFGNQKLLWLDDGTRVRWSVVSDDWQSKTSVGQIRSGGGGGRVLRRGKKKTYFQRKGKKGLDARNISDAIAKRRKRPFQISIDKVIDNATN